jgi:hypothetical protein
LFFEGQPSYGRHGSISLLLKIVIFKRLWTYSRLVVFPVDRKYKDPGPTLPVMENKANRGSRWTLGLTTISNELRGEKYKMAIILPD